MEEAKLVSKLKTLEEEHIPHRWVLLVRVIRNHNAMIFLALEITLVNAYHTCVIHYVLQIAYPAALDSHSNPEQETFHFQEDKIKA